jgi:hypothetical protein
MERRALRVIVSTRYTLGSMHPALCSSRDQKRKSKKIFRNFLLFELLIRLFVE